MRGFLRKCGVSLPATIQPSPEITDARPTSMKHLNELFHKKSIPMSSIFLPFSHQTDFRERDFITADPFTDRSGKKSGKKHGPFGYAAYRLKNVVGFLVEDWLFLALLGIIVALLSLSMDLAIEMLLRWHVSVIDYANAKTEGMSNILSTYAVWSLYAVALVICSAVFVHYMAPQAIGSGIPEMKTILRGVILKEYLTFRTLISKMVGLTLALGSGMPIGKEGPFVHVASVVANLLSSMVQSLHGIAYANESRSSEMLAAACAVGVSSTFSAPIGGVLFSIEVTSVYFAVRNYWRGFFAAACSATLFRLMRVILSKTEVTVVAFYQTTFPRESFFPEELPVFAIIGIVCGFLSAAFIYIQRSMVLFLRKNKYAKSIFQKHWVIYPVVIAFLVSSLTYPKGFGKFLAGEKKFSHTARDFFVNCTWNKIGLPLSFVINNTHFCDNDFLEPWTGQFDHSVFVNLTCFILVYFFLTPLASTLPIPSGIFGPSFVFGAAVGRMVGEMMAVWYPEGIRGPDEGLIFPGVYAVVGAAAFCGGVTHTVSVAVIVFELTGQLMYILPVMIAVLISNAICSYLQPSIYDSIIQIKHLPYLPDIPASSSHFHGIRVEQFMTKNVHFLSLQSTYGHVQNIILQSPHLKAFPVVENESNYILIGSCSRSKLIRALDSKLGQQSRQAEANHRIKAAIENIDKRFQMVDQKRASIVAEKRPSILPNDSSDNANNHRKFDAIDNEEVPSSPDAQGNGKKRFTVVPVSQPVDTNTEAVPNGAAPAGRIAQRRGGISLESSSNCLQKITPPMSPDQTKTTVPVTQANNNISSDAEAQSDLLSPFSRSENRSRSMTAPNPHSLAPSQPDTYSTIGGVIRTLTRFSVGKLRKSQYDTDYDLHGDERKAWEAQQLASTVDFSGMGVDPAPFQLVEHSSLFKVHSLFSLLGLSRAYVTNCGRLVGVVALKDLRVAVEKVQSGQLTAESPPLWNDVDPELGEAPGDDQTTHSSDAEEDDEDTMNDVLTPRLEVISRRSTMYGADFDLEAVKERDNEMRRTSGALKEAMTLLAKGALSANSDPCLAGAENAKTRAKSHTEYYRSSPDESDTSSKNSATDNDTKVYQTRTSVLSIPTILLTTPDELENPLTTDSVGWETEKKSSTASERVALDDKIEQSSSNKGTAENSNENVNRPVKRYVKRSKSELTRRFSGPIIKKGSRAEKSYVRRLQSMAYSNRHPDVNEAHP
ncbi:voltage gated chloride channel domain-containing protein [Ditylenchus destructor]|nr:voltage gated chloride channel domain-containing protein [Ditylenchus destructor]